MFINNIRMGFATNSSSTHSFILVNDKKILDSIHDDNYENDYSFGWEHFTLKTTESKKSYLAAILHNALIRKNINKQFIPIIINNILGLNLDGSEEIGIDHQSNIEIPNSYSKYGSDDGINLEFFDDLKNFILQENIVILGGNDNSDCGHKYDHCGSEVNKLSCITEISTKELIARKDPNDNTWVLFNDRTGGKIRLNFEKDVEYSKSYAPELVDIKITDFCDSGCRYCYQDSTANGSHSKQDNIRMIASLLADLGVFEVALGGGDPISHPSFISIIERFKSSKVVPNFSTRNISWLKDANIRHKVFSICGCVGFSIDSSTQYLDISNILKDNNIEKRNAKFQYVVGAQPENNFKNFINDISSNYKYDLLLLGFKSIGRGKQSINYKYDWLDFVNKSFKNSYSYIGVDTCLAKDLVGNENIDKVFYTTEEGKFSMYIDAVNMKMGPSSFCDQSMMVDIPMINKWCIDKNKFLEIYNSW